MERSTLPYLIDTMPESQPFVRLEEPGRFQLHNEPTPTTSPGEALVRIHRIGVCGTDLHAFAGRQPFFDYPRVLGHELGAEIISLHPDTTTGLKPGDRCAIEPYLNDPASPASQAGKTNCCEKLQVLGVHTDGAMRPLITVPADKLHKSDKLSYDQLALVETLCIGAHAIERSQPDTRDTVLVVGTGPIGLGALQFALTTGATVWAMDADPDRLAFVRDQLNIPETFAPDDPLPTPPTVVIDATGHAGSMARATSLASHGGRIVFLGIVQGTIPLDDPEFHRRELTLMASRNATASTFKHVIASLENGTVDTSPWITHRLTLTEVPEKFPPLKGSPGLVKAIIEVPTNL